MNDIDSALGRLRKAYEEDEALRRRFADDPRAVLAEHGLPAPDPGVTFAFADGVLRAIPAGGGAAGALDDAALEGVSGGTAPDYATWLASVTPGGTPAPDTLAAMGAKHAAGNL